MNGAIALVAHDACKDAMLAFAAAHADVLKRHRLVATRTTGTMLNDKLKLNAHCLLSGPRGGDLQIGAMVAEGTVGLIIFLRDVMSAQPHEPDISALLRAADVHNVPVATNVATAHALVKALL
jgi:methylglyoxal synthase